MEHAHKRLVIGITGASGFIGKNLSEYMQKKGFETLSLNRGFNAKELEKCNIVVNLAGATINKRWSKSYKKKILESRLDTTKKITTYIKKNKNISLLISASAVGIYSSENKNYNDEYSNIYGNNFLSYVCKEWEKEALSVKEITKVAITRFGLVLSEKGGALPKMTLPAKFGIATILGRGDQIISWIMLEDLLRAINFIIENQIEGVVNMCAPNPITNKELTKKIAKKFNSFIIVKTPSFLLKLIMGEASSILLKGQYVISKRLVTNGFVFRKEFFLKKIEKTHYF